MSSPGQALEQAPDYTLYVTPDDPKLHWRSCSRLDEQAPTSLTPASGPQRDELPVCPHCCGTMAGPRRETYSHLEDSMEALPLAVENRARVREVFAAEPALRSIRHLFLWIPASRQYIGVSSGPGRVATAYINRGFVDIYRGSGTYDRETLPTHGAPAGGSRVAHSGAAEQGVCPRCFTQLPATGRCDSCDD